MTAGDTVRISEPRRGAVIGSVLHVATPAELPTLGAEWDPLKVRQVREILREWDVTHIVLLTHVHVTPTGPREAAFFAFEIAGQWRDLHGQLLTIEPVGEMYELLRR